VKQYAIWVPHLKKHFTKWSGYGGGILLLSEEKAKELVASAPGYGYKVVPWNDVARRIENGEAV
jgi:hypothetical protein